MTMYKKVHYVLLHILTSFSHLIQFLILIFLSFISHLWFFLTKKNISDLHNTSWHNLPRQILFPYNLLLFYRYVTIKELMYFTVNTPVHVFGGKRVFCHIPHYLMYMTQIEVHYNHHFQFLKPQRHQMLQNCLLSVKNNNVIPFYPVDRVKPA
jgi:hypothetical protein